MATQMLMKTEGFAALEYAESAPLKHGNSPIPIDKWIQLSPLKLLGVLPSEETMIDTTVDVPQTLPNKIGWAT